jgi:hypothetical protein
MNTLWNWARALETRRERPARAARRKNFMCR